MIFLLYGMLPDTLPVYSRLIFSAPVVRSLNQGKVCVFLQLCGFVMKHCKWNGIIWQS